MDKKFLHKASNFFKKEGFYVILFVCLCIVATVAVMTSRITKSPVKPPVVNQQSKNDSKGDSLVAQQPDEQYNNALEVRKNSNSTRKTANTNSTTKTAKNTSTAVSKSVDTTFAKPVEGTLARAYSETPVWSDTTETYRPNFGIDIKANLGKAVKAVLTGKVIEVGANEDGYGTQVVIDHQNGVKTVYANLDKNSIQVKKGQAVKKGGQIGKVGNTSLRTAFEKYGSHLHFEVLKSNEQVDPARYVKYSTK